MVKDYAWETFKRTGSIDSYILFKEIERRNNNKKENTK